MNYALINKTKYEINMYMQNQRHIFLMNLSPNLVIGLFS
jgi:hypothetical protein